MLGTTRATNLAPRGRFVTARRDETSPEATFRHTCRGAGGGGGEIVTGAHRAGGGSLVTGAHRAGRAGAFATGARGG